MSIDTLTADTSISRASPQVARKNWETPVPNGIQENEVPDTGTVDMDFWDFVDIVNPLQHIPVVNTIYRELTGDSIKGVSRIIGGGIFGGVIGLVAGIGSAIVAETTGKDPGEHVLAMLTGSDDETPATTGNTAVADAAHHPRRRRGNGSHASRYPGNSCRILPARRCSHRSGRRHRRHDGTRRRRRRPDARSPRLGSCSAPPWRAGSPELPCAQAHGGPHAPARAGRDRTGGQYRQDAGPACRCPACGGKGEREADCLPGAAADRGAHPAEASGADGGMAAERPRPGSAGTGGRHDDERVGQV